MAQPIPISTDAAFASERTELEAKASALAITSQADYETAAGFLRDVKSLLKRVADTFDPIQKKAHAAWKEVLAKRARSARGSSGRRARQKRAGAQKSARPRRLRGWQRPRRSRPPGCTRRQRP